MSEDEHDLVDAIETADLEDLLPKLAVYAERRMSRVGWFTSAARESHRMDPRELVDLAIERCLSGKRHWKKSSKCLDLESFFRGVIKSLVSTAKKADSRSPVELSEEGDVDNVAGGPFTPQSEIAAAIEACASDDEELMAFYVTLLDGNTKREEIATALGWNVERVSRVRIKLQRRLETQYPALFGGMKKRRAS